MKTANLSWEDVMKQTGDGQKITVHYDVHGDGIHCSGFWYEDHMMEMFSGCELLRLTNTDYQVTKWPDKRSGN